MNWINNINTTNLKIVTGCVAFWQLVTSVIIFEFLGKHFNEVLFLEASALVTAWAGVSYAQFAKKRDTTIVTPPQTTAENATGEMVVDKPPRPILTRQAAEEAADVYAGKALGDEAVG